MTCGHPVYLVPGWAGRQWAAVGLGLAICVAMIVQTIVVRGRPDSLAAVRGQLGAVATIAPRTRREQRVFDVLSVSAGVCEEIVYRGLVLGTLAILIGLWPAVVVSTVLFGLAHLYQGRTGALHTGAFGAVAALLTVWSGPVFLAVAVHSIVNLSQSRLVASTLREAGE